MAKTSENWTQEVIDLCLSLSSPQISELQERLPLVADKRVALVLRIGALRHRLINIPSSQIERQAAEAHPLVGAVEIIAPEPSEPEPIAPPPIAPRPKKKVSFSGVSLDDASSLLSAFGAAPNDGTEPRAE